MKAYTAKKVRMSKLTAADRKYLRQRAHPLKAIVQVGNAGVTDGLIQAVDHALEEHELIKVRFVEHKASKKALSEQIAERTSSEIAGMVGHVSILYRQAEVEERRRISLPSQNS